MPTPLHLTAAQAKRLEKNLSKSGHGREFRPDLSDYLVYVEALKDKLNEDGIYSMSLTDAVKIAIEKAIEKLLPDVEIKKTRKKYVRLNF